MNYKIDASTDAPAYLQLYYQLREDIIKGVYPYNSKLPSKRTIAEECGVSVITVEHTLELLCDEGYTEAKQRSGVFCVYRERDFYGNKSANIVDENAEKTMVSLSIGQNEKVGKNKEEDSDVTKQEFLFPYSTLAKIMRRVLADYSERILNKSPGSGCDELKEQIKLYLGRSVGINVEKSQIVIGAGAEYLYGLVAQLFGTNSVIAIENPSYEKIIKVYEAEGIKCEKLKLYKDGIRYEDLESSGAKILHVTPFNSFPSGISVGISKKKEYLHWASEEEKKRYIVEDNYDSELTVSSKMEDTLFAMATEGNVIYLNTFSKTIAPSLRVGYMILPKELVGEYEEKLGFYSCPVPLYEQLVIAEVIKSGDFERHINRVRRQRRHQKLSVIVE